jgi:hypothetical protein
VQLQEFLLASSNMPTLNFNVHPVHKLHCYVPLSITIPNHIVTINGTEMTMRLVKWKSSCPSSSCSGYESQVCWPCAASKLAQGRSMD